MSYIKTIRNHELYYNMKHKYIYIEAPATIDETTRIYFVMIGNGKQATRDFLRLVAHATDHNHYFERYTTETADFMLKVIKSVPAMLQPTAVDARQFVRDLKIGSRPTLSQAQRDNNNYSLPYLKINYRPSSIAKRSNV